MIGTFVPLSALSSLNSQKEDQGTFQTGLVFLDWLKKTGQNAWQLLPLHETQLEKGSSNNRVPSPYKGYGIGLDPKYLSGKNPKYEFLNSKQIQNTNLQKFIFDNSDWLDDYALFCALSDHFGTDDWREWEIGLRSRDKKSLDKWSKKLKKEIDEKIFIQYQLRVEYEELRQKAVNLKISLIGDLPFYVSVKSPLVWAHQEVFMIEKTGNMEYVSGVPDSPFSRFGRQIWGHPIYKWSTKSEQKVVLDFWFMRLKYISTLFDCVRIDYANGFFDYSFICLKDNDKDGFAEGPGAEVFKELVKYGQSLGLFIFAEDNGKNIHKLRGAMLETNVSGIKILRFAFDEKENRAVRHYADLNNYPMLSVAYTSTHDTETLLGYLKLLSPSQKKVLAESVNIIYSSDNKEFSKRLRNGVIVSAAKTVIIPIQDWLLTTDRINIPGTEKEVDDLNWHYKVGIPIENLPTSF